MGAAADKGWGGVGNGSPMEGPAQITEAADFLAALIDTEVEAVADLPGSGNYIGRKVFVVAKSRIYRWSSSGWKAIYGKDETATISAAPTPGNTITVGAAAWLRKDISDIVRGYVDIGRSVANGGVTSGTVFGIMPANFRPQSAREFPGTVTGSTSAGALVRIAPDGNITLFADGSLPTNAATFRAPFEYPAAT